MRGPQSTYCPNAVHLRGPPRCVPIGGGGCDGMVPSWLMVWKKKTCQIIYSFDILVNGEKMR